MHRQVAALYDRHAGRYGRDLARGLIGVAGLRRGQLVLDVGCGTGQLTAALAEVVGARAVVAVDPSESFVGACRERVPGANVRVAGAEALPFDDDVYDAAFAQLVVNLLPAPVAGIAEMRRVTDHGGVVAACVWDSGRMPLLHAFWDAAAEIAPESVRDVRRDQQVGQPDAGRLADVFAAGGLTAVRTGALEASAAYEGFSDLWEPFAGGVGRSGALCASLDEPHRTELERAVRRRLGDPDGPFTLTARAWYATGRVPDHEPRSPERRRGAGVPDARSGSGGGQ